MEDNFNYLRFVVFDVGVSVFGAGCNRLIWCCQRGNRDQMGEEYWWIKLMLFVFLPRILVDDVLAGCLRIRMSGWRCAFQRQWSES